MKAARSPRYIPFKYSSMTGRKVKPKVLFTPKAHKHSGWPEEEDAPRRGSPGGAPEKTFTPVVHHAPARERRVSGPRR